MATPTPALVTALSRAAACLDTEGLAWALVGGLAVGVRGEPRVTRDVDLVLPVDDDADAEQRVFLLQRHGLLADVALLADPGRDAEGLVLAAREERVRARPPRRLDNAV